MLRRMVREKAVRGSGITWLDVKLAVRMLVRYPGLTAVSVIGMAVGIAITAGAFAVLYTFLSPWLPFDEGDRVVSIQVWDAAANRAERRVLRDFTEWRGHLRSLEDLGVYRQVMRNLITSSSQPEPVRIAAITASAFTVARVAPLLGRTLASDDEHAGAIAVAVVGDESARPSNLHRRNWPRSRRRSNCGRRCSCSQGWRRRPVWC